MDTTSRSTSSSCSITREKVRIAQAAVALIRDGETIILDSGTTTAEIARALRKLDAHLASTSSPMH